MFADASHAVDALSTRFNVAMEAQRLDRALKSFSRQAHLDVTVLAEKRAKTYRSPSIKGEFSDREVLDRLLAGTDLNIIQKGENAFVVVLRAPVKRQMPEETTSGPESINHPDTIVITGSNLRDNDVPIAPVTSYSPNDLGVDFGRVSADQIGSRMVQNFPLVSSQTSFAANVNPLAGNNFARGDAFNLLGASPEATVVLYDGHRLPPGGFNGSAVDFSLLPWPALYRLDAMLGGASAIYGSDAVSGVLNFVPARSFPGAEPTLYYGDATSGKSS